MIKYMKRFLKECLKAAATRSSVIKRLALFVARETVDADALWKASRSAFVSAGKHAQWSRRVIAAYGQATYDQHREAFLRNGFKSQYGPSVRANLLDRFEVVDANVQSGTTRTDGILLAEALLSMVSEGELVECGCYAGASTSKLSILANILGKKLYVFDSFEGLPQVDRENLRDFHARRGHDWVSDWAAGRYAAQLDLVRSNVELYGEIDACIFVKGWFSEALFAENLPRRVSFAFVDADIASSVKECIRAIWPRLAERGVFFSHDVAYIKVLQVLHDREMWTKVFDSYPPIIFGAGFGYGEYSPHLGFMVKGASATAEYINSLTLEK
jgi:O-methyltransferase